MYHPAERQFRNEHNSAQYLIQTGALELPPGDTTFTIHMPRPRKFEWPSIGSMIAYAVPPLAGMGLPPVVDIPRTRLKEGGEEL